MTVTSHTNPLGSWHTIADIFGDHRSPAYKKLARACTVERHIVEAGSPLLVLHAVRLAALQGRGMDPWSGDAEAFRDDLYALREEITVAVQRGLVQFTEPLRMTDLLPGLLMAAARYPGRPMRLIDIGACAGFHLVPECYRIRYPGGEWSPASATVPLECSLDVPPRLLEQEIIIIDRIGIDLAPVDPAAPGTAAYLRSFAWAGDPAREQRLLDTLAAIAPFDPEVLAGNAAKLLPALLERYVSHDTVTVVIDSAVSHYLPGKDALRMSRTLDQMAGCGALVMIARGGNVPNGVGLPTSVRFVDLSRPWRIIYAASDMLSERMQWVGSPE